MAKTQLRHSAPADTCCQPVQCAIQGQMLMHILPTLHARILAVQQKPSRDIPVWAPVLAGKVFPAVAAGSLCYLVGRPYHSRFVAYAVANCCSWTQAALHAVAGSEDPHHGLQKSSEHSETSQSPVQGLPAHSGNRSLPARSYMGAEHPKTDLPQVLHCFVVLVLQA